VITPRASEVVNATLGLDIENASSLKARYAPLLLEYPAYARASDER
jgi:hypothetical protein